MPIINAYADHPTRPYVRVEINWADVPAATHAGVSRVDVATGECTPLRPYICYNGWELLLSCGHGTFWDTEAPFDRPFYYVTTSSEAPCVPDVDPCVPCVPVSANTSADPITLANDGGFWLKDPVRPCNDRPVPLCAPSAPLLPSCGADGAITFVEISAEIYADNSLRMRPMNRRRAISMTRPRSDVTTSLVLETTSFTARDEVLELAAPGTPLLFQGAPEYGVPDRYMAVGAVTVERQIPDHRFQFRKVTLPYEAVDRPAGPTQGICGTRVADICDLYPTWDDLAAAGFTWDDLIRGNADPAVANPARRTWDDVNAEFADWDAVNTGGRTWTGLEVGD